jgi:hypothetical protein
VTLCLDAGPVIDPVSGAMYIADSENHRVIRVEK